MVPSEYRAHGLARQITFDGRRRRNGRRRVQQGKQMLAQHPHGAPGGVRLGDETQSGTQLGGQTEVSEPTA
jgi:hypothetical protein